VFLGDYVKKGEIGGTRSMYEGNKTYIKNFRKTKEMKIYV
jgi:hypothetical protein